MTYLQLINRFWEIDQDHQFSSHETRLYFLLLNKAIRMGAASSLCLNADSVMSTLGVSDRRTVSRARDRLVEAGLISFTSTPGRGNKTEYVICGMACKTSLKRGDKRGEKRVDKPCDKTTLFSTDKSPLLEEKVEKKDGKIPPFTPCKYNYNITSTNVDVDEYSNGSGENRQIGVKNFMQNTVDILDVEEAVDTMRKDMIWREAECMKLGVEQADIDSLLDTFSPHCRGMGEERKTLQKFKYHFDSLLRKRRYQKSNNQDETRREDRFSRRRGVDTSSLRPEDYT